MKKIYLGNLSFRITEEELENIFSEYGDIVSVNLIKDRDTGRLKGFGFIEFETEEQAKAALVMDGKEIQGRTTKVNMAREQQQRSPRSREREY